MNLIFIKSIPTLRHDNILSVLVEADCGDRTISVQNILSKVIHSSGSKCVLLNTKLRDQSHARSLDGFHTASTSHVHDRTKMPCQMTPQKRCNRFKFTPDTGVIFTGSITMLPSIRLPTVNPLDGRVNLTVEVPLE